MALPERKNIRAKFHDYSGGEYFVTICTADKEHYFGRIVGGTMHFTEIGKYASAELENITSHYPYAEILHYVVMPNHIHAIVVIEENVGMHRGASAPESGENVGMHRGASASPQSALHMADAPRCIPTKRTALGVVIGGFKQAVTRYARRNGFIFDWQKRFHDHIIRGSQDGFLITDYINNNVARWDSDCFNDKNCSL